MISSFKAGVGVMTAVLLSGGILGACSAKITGSAPILEADLPAQYAQAICGGIQGCCTKVSYPYDSAACVARQTAIVQNGLSKGRPTDAVYDAAAAGRCVAKLQEIAASCADPADEGRSLGDACSFVFVGKKQVGEPCENGGACAPRSDGRVLCESYSLSSATPDGGTGNLTQGSQCTLYKAPATGDPCGFTSAGGAPASTQGDCAGSRTGPFYCDYKTATCQPRIAIGQPCSGSSINACASGGVCKAGVCVAPSAGMDCLVYSTDCGNDLYCAAAGTANGTCVAKKNAGEACGQSGLPSECASGRCSKGKCSAGSLATAETCSGASEKGSSSSGGPVTTDGG